MSKLDRFNLLVSWPYYNLAGERLDRWWQSHDHEVNLLVDSGAFTAYKQGKIFHLDDYCRFLEKLPCRPWGYFQLDVIGDPDASWKNYCTMVERGFSPIPVFQRGEDPAMLEPMFESSDLVAIGGVAGTNGAKNVVKELMDNYVWGRNVHWLGFGSSDFLKVYQPYSFDTTSWKLASSFILADIYMGGGKFIKFGRDQVTPAFWKKHPRLRDILELRYGLPKQWLESSSSIWSNYRGLCVLSAASHSMFMEDLFERFGTYYFMGCAADFIWHASILLDAWKRKGTNDFAPLVECAIRERVDYGQRNGGKGS